MMYVVFCILFLFPVKPTVPEIELPVEIVENRQLRETFTCSADVGHPEGHLRWKMRYENETDFRNISFNETITSEEHNCSTVVTKSFTLLPSPEHEGIELMCEVENNETLPDIQKLWSKATIHIIRG